MQIDVLFSWQEVPENRIAVDYAVVIDTLRATTTLSAFFAQGVQEILAVREVDDAYAVKDHDQTVL
ncbi:MAG: 2-phosphosulfolactate phosphatase, partial [Firmicutes bacterium]|nr:2-phosphosulfolactate phosphatase [Bacillota bacterium]